MKILLATGLYPPEVGGPATYTKLLEERLPSFGIEVVVLPFRDVRHLPPGIRHLAYFWKCYWLARNADVVYAQDTVSVGLPATLAAKLAGKKFLVRVPGDYAWEQARQRFGVEDELNAFQNKKYSWRVELFRKIQKYVVKSAVTVVVPSEYMNKIVVNWTDSNKIQTIYSSVEIPVQYQLPENRPEGFLVVTAARLVPWKGIFELIWVLEEKKNWKMIVVGEGPLHNSLKGQADQKAPGRIYFTGQLNHMQTMGWIKAADVFVLNSTYEGLSHVLIETMALGTPIVATEIGGNPELIENQKEGLLVKPFNESIGALRIAIEEVEKNKTDALKRAQAAREKVDNFSILTTIEQISELLKSI